MKKSILTCAAVISACLVMSVSAYAGTWLQLGQNNWTYIEDGYSVKTGWISDSNKTYYIDPATNLMVTGWKYIGGVPYLFGSDGALINCFTGGASNMSTETLINGFGKTLPLCYGNNYHMAGTAAGFGMSGESETDRKSYEEISGEVYAMVNAYRAENGKNALLLNGTLSGVAMKRAEELSRNYSHIRPDGSRCFTLMKENGYSYIVAAENIAFGQTSSGEAFVTWINSSGHRRNILGDFTEIGIGVYKNNGTYYWVQEFGRK
ncbi:CAP domain-containing protein [Oribacterium sp. P6A1]|uniref:CAP domain-containing protein n=1 Tax=Oribacterium sp. P6A1 TaxID=1410612 RepID=UPI00068B33F6|nr:CAP domain-containing protein [Oribacterium sp. P6A1]